MECDEVARRLWEYLDSELAAKEARAVTAHLAGCAACRCRCRRDRALLACLGRARACCAPAPDGLRRRLDDSIPREPLR